LDPGPRKDTTLSSASAVAKVLRCVLNLQVPLEALAVVDLQPRGLGRDRRMHDLAFD
jgi:hypothetical protein